jgi:hypothetical protein
MSHWTKEEEFCRSVRARVVEIPPIGQSERVPLIDVLVRKVWFPDVGLFLLYSDTGAVQYVGRSNLPLGVRLRMAIANGKTWTRSDYRLWTVAMLRAPEYPADIDLQRELIATLSPPFNVIGRPKKIHAGVNNELEQLKARVEVLQRVCADAYQLAGLVGAPARVLDTLDEAASGRTVSRETFLPLALTEFDILD